MTNEVQQVDKTAADDTFNDILGDAYWAAETGKKRHEENAKDTLAEHFAAHRQAETERMEREVVQPLREALVEAAIPLKAMVISGSITRLPHALHAGVHDALNKIRPIINKLADLTAKEMKHNRAAQALAKGDPND